MSTDTATGRVPELTLGWRLQMALGAAKMTVQEMADEFGMSRTSLSRWLNDRGTPPRQVFIKQWALRTGVSASWLLRGDVPRSPDGPTPGAEWAPSGSNRRPTD